MTETTNRRTRIWSSRIALAGVFIAGMFIGSWMTYSTPVSAQLRQAPPREAFKSGGARSEVVLREMSSTLKRIEAQVGRIDQTLTKISKKP